MFWGITTILGAIIVGFIVATLVIQLVIKVKIRHIDDEWHLRLYTFIPREKNLSWETQETLRQDRLKRLLRKILCGTLWKVLLGIILAIVVIAVWIALDYVCS